MIILDFSFVNMKLWKCHILIYIFAVLVNQNLILKNLSVIEFEKVIMKIRKSIRYSSCLQHLERGCVYVLFMMVGIIRKYRKNRPLGEVECPSLDTAETKVDSEEMSVNEVNTRKGILQFGDLLFNPLFRELIVAGKTTTLCLQEAELLQLFISTPGHFLSSKEIIACFWEKTGTANNANNLLSRLRKGLRESGSLSGLRGFQKADMS